MRRERLKRHLSQAALATLVGVDGQTISNIETGRTRTLKVSNLRKLYEVLELSPQDIAPAVNVAKGADEIPFGQGGGPPEQSRAAEEGAMPVQPFTPLPEGSMRQAKGGRTAVPEYSGVSAVRKDFRDDAETGRADLPGGADGDFIVRLDGQCMEPRYPDRSRVACSVARWQAEGFVHDKDYWIRFEDGESTFKRVRINRHNAHELTLAPLNEQMRPWTVKRQSIALAARATALLID